VFEKIRDNLNEVIDLAEKCPEKYQVKCFEVLLDSLVKAETMPTEAVAGVPPASTEPSGKPKSDFFSQYNILQDEWSRVFHFDGDSWSIIIKAKDLREKAKSKKQIKLALLVGVKNLLKTGESAILRTELIDMCNQYSTYDQGNFAAHMKSQHNLFLRKGDGWILTRPGNEEAAKVIKELAK